MGTLYVVGTPIGNLEDLTPRAARVLGQVDLVAAEDTRVTRRLLNHLGIKVRMTSYHRHNWERRLPALMSALEAGDVALVTDAGMPGVSDPGSDLVARAAAQGFPRLPKHASANGTERRRSVPRAGRSGFVDPHADAARTTVADDLDVELAAGTRLDRLAQRPAIRRRLAR